LLGVGCGAGACCALAGTGCFAGCECCGCCTTFIVLFGAWCVASGASGARLWGPGVKACTASFFLATDEDCCGRVAALWVHFTCGGIPDILKGLGALAVSRACRFRDGCSSSSRTMTSALRLGSVLTALLKDEGGTLLSRACRLADAYRSVGSVPSDLRLEAVLRSWTSPGTV
jgi:hypothetical protein